MRALLDLPPASSNARFRQSADATVSRPSPPRPRIGPEIGGHSVVVVFDSFRRHDPGPGEVGGRAPGKHLRAKLSVR